MENFLKADRVIKKLVGGDREFVIYPFGERGMLVKDILNHRYGVKEKYIVDNVLGMSELNNEIITLEELKGKDISNMTVLLASDGYAKAYSDIRYQLMKYVPLEQIIDVFSISMYFDKEMYYEQASYEHPRLAALEANAREIYYNNVDGAIAECGVYRGKFANHMSRLMPDRKLYLFDTFSGFDERDIVGHEQTDSIEFRKVTNLRDTSEEIALNNIGYRANAIVRKGYFPDTAVGLEDERFAFVSLDTDLYKPILAGLEFFWPRLNPGGYIFVDDLRHPKLRGVRRAVIEFCKREGIGYMSLPDGLDATAVIYKPI